MELTWLGHATFRLEAEGKRIYIDPFLTGNPKCPENEQTPERVDVIAITHGHRDHLGDTVELAKQHGCTVVAPVELASVHRPHGEASVRGGDGQVFGHMDPIEQLGVVGRVRPAVGRVAHHLLVDLAHHAAQAGEIHTEGASADARARSLYELLLTPETIVRTAGTRQAHALARDTVLRGAAPRS